MDYETAKVKIRECKTRSGVYDALEQFGVSVCSTYSLHKRLKDCRAAYQHKACEVIQVAMRRLDQIEDKEV